MLVDCQYINLNKFQSVLSFALILMSSRKSLILSNIDIVLLWMVRDNINNFYNNKISNI